MNIDRDLLRQISAQTKPQASSIAALVRGIHRHPELREWVTFETIALPPIPVPRLGDWGLVSLLTVPKQSNDGNQSYGTPWAVVEWSLATMQVTKKIDLRSIKAEEPLWVSKIIIARPADATVNLNVFHRTLRENALFSSLDKFCSIPRQEGAEFAELAQHYSGILAPEFYPYYHDLVPESKEWLLADIPAISLEPIADEPQKKVPETANFNDNQTISPLPSDLTDKLPNWLQQCSEINRTVAAENQEIAAQMSATLRNIDRRRLLPGFRLAFVGEFSRGKSYLINRLLGGDILPEGTLPTTATLTSIVAGELEQMEVRIGGKTEYRPLEATSWSELLAIDDAGSNREVFAGVRITINHDWLRSLDVEIIDTPGAGDLNDKRANLVFDLLNQCDGAILLVSATSPFSLTEAAFLEQEVIGRHVPRILVAVSNLDKIPSEEKAKVIQNITLKVHRIDANIPVIATYPVAELSREPNSLSILMNQIEYLVDRGERRIWRSRQVTQQISDWLERIIEIAQAAMTRIKMNAQERKIYVQQAQNQLEKSAIDWENIRLELERRRLHRAKEIRQRIYTIRGELVENLDFELQKTADIKGWWERDLPFRLRREMTILSRNVESILLKFLAEDIDWSQHHLKSLFATTIKHQSSPSPNDNSIPLSLSDREMTDLQKYRLLTRIGTTAAMIGGSILGGPIGMAASTGVLIFSEKYLDRELDKQRELLSADLKRVIDTALDRYCQEIAERLKQLYQSLSNDIEQEQSTWILAKKATLNLDGDRQNAEPHWQGIIDCALALKQEIDV
jgi:GTPase SAR1 family protein